MHNGRKLLNYPAYGAVKFGTSALAAVFHILNWRRPRVLIYTDSRGYEITRIRNKKNPFSSYAGDLIRKYSVTYKIAPKRHTTILDFLESYGARAGSFDAVILHCGIVDFSPRPRSDLEAVYRSKWPTLSRYIPADALERNLAHTDLGNYEGEPTAPIYPLEAARQYVVPLLKRIPNLVWIGPNRVLPDWRGNYHRDRPGSMHIVEDYTALFAEELRNVIDLRSWTDAEVQRFTVDNIHLSQEGFEFLLSELKVRLRALP